MHYLLKFTSINLKSLIILGFWNVLHNLINLKIANLNQVCEINCETKISIIYGLCKASG